MKTPLVILGGARPHGDTRRAVELALEGKAELMVLPETSLGGDDFGKLAEKILAHQRIVFATPIYWFAMSGAMKLFLDRFNDVFETARRSGQSLEGKEVWVIAAGTEEFLPDGFEASFRAIARHFSMTYRGCAYLYTGEDGDLRQASEMALAAYGAKI